MSESHLGSIAATTRFTLTADPILSLEQAFRIGNWGAEDLAFHLPYIEMDKESILQDALTSCESLGLEFDEVSFEHLDFIRPRWNWTIERPNGIGCGTDPRLPCHRTQGSDRIPNLMGGCARACIGTEGGMGQ